MEIASERVCLCQYLHSLAEEEGMSMNTLAEKTGQSLTQLYAILEGNISPTLDELILITNALGMKITVNDTVSFAQKKIEHQLGY